MTEDQFQLLCELLHEQNHLLRRLVDAAEQKDTPDPGKPRYEYSLEEYRGFDWGRIEAEIIEEDRDGPTRIRWRGNIYPRRSPQNKFGAAIWYSRAIGKDESGKTLYDKLIIFKEIAKTAIDPLPQPVAQRVATTEISDRITSSQYERLQNLSTEAGYTGGGRAALLAKYGFSKGREITQKLYPMLLQEASDRNMAQLYNARSQVVRTQEV